MNYLKHMVSELGELLGDLDRARLSFQVLELAMNSDACLARDVRYLRRAYGEVLGSGLAQLDQCRIDLGIFERCLSAGEVFKPD